MRKSNLIPVLFSGFLILSLSSSAFAQWSVGISGGLLLTDIEKSPLAEGEPQPTNLTSLQLSIPVEIGIGRLFAIQPEIMYGTHGGLQEWSSISEQPGIKTETSSRFEYQITTLEIPILAKLKLGSEDLQIQFMAGPSIGIGLDGYFKSKIAFEITTPLGIYTEGDENEWKAAFVSEGYADEEVDEDEYAVSKFNLNVHLGAALSIKIGGPYLFLNGRFIAGISDLRPEQEGESTNYEYLSRRIGVSAGIMFPL